jgi:hypothetical protein
VTGTWVVVIVSTFHFLLGHRPWLSPFFGDLLGWLAHPHIAGGPSLPSDWPVGFLVVAAMFAVGWLGSDLVLARSTLGRQRTARFGLALILGPCVAGYAGMVAVVAGKLTAPTVAAVSLAIVALLSLMWVLRRSMYVPKGPPVEPPRSSSAPRSDTDRRLGRALAILVGTVVALAAIHAAMSPVTEWDGLIYHAATAKLWFLQRPHANLGFGPSTGIQISAHFPPLFPAIGAATYTVLNHFDDFYLRMVPPVLLLGTTLLTYGYARWRFGTVAARWAVLLLIGCPLIVMYGAWTTGYMLLTALTMATIACTDVAAETGSRSAWIAAGVMAGLGILTHFIGLLLLGVGLLGWFFRTPTREGRTRSQITSFVVTAVLVASPWLVANLIRLHDPFYPLGAPLFHGRGLASPLWTASQAEIKNSAVSYWGYHPSFLRLRELATPLLDRHLLPAGVLVGLAVGLWRWRRGDRRWAHLVATVGLLAGAQALPGWYWIRYMIVLMPAAAVLVGGVIASLRWPERVRDARPLARIASGRSLAIAGTAFVVAASAVVGLALSVTGPGHAAWTTNIRGENLMKSVRDLGSTQDALWTVYGGDALSWEWLNDHLSGTQRVATLDVRLYYFRNPQALFYLDGSEANALVGLTSSPARAFLAAHNVRYVMLPAFAVADTASRHPAMDVIPFLHELGGADFPPVALFAPAGWPAPTVIYSVGPDPAVAGPAVFPGIEGVPVKNPASEVTIPAGMTDPRVYVPTQPGRPTALTLEYDNSQPGVLEINQYDERTHQWKIGVSAVKRTGRPGWASMSLPLAPGPNGYVDLGIFADRNPARIRNLRATSPTQPILPGSASAGGGVSIVSTSDTEARLFVPTSMSGKTVVTFQYHDTVGSFDVNRFDDARGQWDYGVASGARKGSFGWVTTSFVVDASPTGYVQLGIFARDADLEVRNVTATAPPPVSTKKQRPNR